MKSNKKNLTVQIYEFYYGHLLTQKESDYSVVVEETEKERVLRSLPIFSKQILFILKEKLYAS